MHRILAKLWLSFTPLYHRLLDVLQCNVQVSPNSELGAVSVFLCFALVHTQTENIAAFSACICCCSVCVPEDIKGSNECNIKIRFVRQSVVFCDER